MTVLRSAPPRDATCVATPTAVHERVVAHGASRPSAVAVADGRGVVSYRELDERSGALAAELRGLGVGPEVVVGVLAERSPRLVVAALAVLRAGGAYLPLDPTYRAERIRHIVADARPPVVLSDASLARLLPGDAGATTLLLDGDGVGTRVSPYATSAGVDPQGAAYVVYTSGTTGVPKGVVVPHAGLANLVDWHITAYAIGPGDRTGHVAAEGFDAAVWEVWPTLVAGGTVVMPRDDIRLRPDALLAWIADEGLTVTFLPTPLAEEVMRLPCPRGLTLRALLVGGDRLTCGPPPGAPYQLVNHYGPTEATVVATAGAVAPAGAGPPDIGRPIAGVDVVVVDTALRPVPPGTAGELCIGGSGLARGYVGRAAETAERFVPAPCAHRPGERIYRSGDVVRCRADGALEYLGRGDDQVKVRGVRVEPAEVEMALRAHADVRDAVVVARGDAATGLRLVGYVTPEAGRRPDPAGLRESLRQVLPEAMVPARFVVVERFPLSPNGKVDRAALPDPAAGEAAPREMPRDAVEETVAGFFAEALDLPAESRPGAHESFFELGGHSLLANRVLSRVAAVFGMTLPFETLFAAPTVAGFAAALRRQEPVPGRVAAIARAWRVVEDMSDDEVAGQLTGHHTDDERRNA